MTLLTPLSYVTTAVVLLTCVVRSENLGGDEFSYWEEDLDSPLRYVVGRAGENCREACWTQGYPTCISNVGTADEVVEVLYAKVPYGIISIWDAAWAEDYHPIIEEDGTFIGWDEIPETAGNCSARPPQSNQRRLCRCTIDGCDDTFTFCRILRFVCGKYGYTRSVCQASCSTCENLLEISDPDLFATYEEPETNDGFVWPEGGGGDFEGGEFGGNGFAP